MKSARDQRYIEFIAVLRAARLAAGLTQADLARALAKPQSYISKVETCERRIDVVETADWCRALSLTVDSVLPPSIAASGKDRGARRNGTSRRSRSNG